MPSITVTTHDTLPDNDAQVVDEGLSTFNLAAAPLDQVRPLGCFARDEAGTVVGGAVGRTWGVCCELQQLWVADEHRRQGIGTGLVQEFHQQAAARGCRTFFLETFSFQAPALYQRLGYAIASEITGFAPGVTKYLMVRRT